MKAISSSMWAMGRILLFVICMPALGLAAGAAGGQAGDVSSGHTAYVARTLPASLRPVLYRVLAKNAGAAYAIGQDGCVTLPKHSLKACFDAEGVHFTGAGADAPLALRLRTYGRGGALSPVRPVRPETNGNRVSYQHGSLTEWWRVLPMGFEQGFTLAHRPGGNGALVLMLTASDQASKRHQALGWGELRYGKLVVTDANGEVVPATLESEGKRIRIVINDARAAYPLTVDPLVWLEQKVTESNGAAFDAFGNSVAVFGSTALIGTPFATVNGTAYQGAVYVFTRLNGVWTQTQKLTASDGAFADDFGTSVALSGDTAFIGTPFADISGNSSQGAVYVFTESNGVWSQVQKLIASDGTMNNNFGSTIALDGSTALIGAFYADVGDNSHQGTAYVFSESGGNWTQTAKLVASDGAAGDEFGLSVALNGSTALVGTYATINGNIKQGAAYVFSESGSNWAQTAKLVADDGAAGDEFGNSVALEGSTALIGAYDATIGGSSYQGAAYVFTKSDGVWTQTQKLIASDGASLDDFGISVALSGTTALIGAWEATIGNNTYQGAAYLFTNSGGIWNQTRKLTASDGTAYNYFGSAVALSDTTVLVGSPDANIDGNESQGAAYFYGERDLGLTVSAPQTVGQGQEYISQTIATNSSSMASPAVSATITVPAAASFVSATTSQGNCSEASEVVTCDFGQIEGNAGTATANVTLKVTGSPGTTIENTASIAKATPALTASAATGITSPGSCAAGYTEFDGHLDAGGTFTSPPIEVTEAGQKYVDLTAPASFAFFAITNTRYGQHTYVYPHKKHGHRWGAAGSYQVGAQAGATGGDYTLCVQLNPPQ